MTIRDIEQQHMSAVPEVLTWTVDGVGEHGPVTMTLRLPVVTITDAAGRFIEVIPAQADVIASRLTDLHCVYEDMGTPCS